MGVKVKTKVDKIPEIQTTLKSINRKKIKVGSLKGENQWLAGIHEYGVNIEVTPKMRVFLHSQGLHLKKSTKYIVIPERSFLRTGHDENAERIITQTERALSQVIAGKMSVDTMCDLCGEQLATAIKEYMTKTAPNHPFTVERKGSSTPLADSGGLIESITREVEG